MVGPADFPFRRWRGRLLLTYVVVAGLAAPAAAAPDPVAAKKAEVEQLARALDQQGERVSILAERLNQARLQAAELSDQVAAARTELRRAEGQVTGARTRLRGRLVAAYTGGIQPPGLAFLTTGPIAELPVRRTYVEAVAGRDRFVIDELETARVERDERRRRVESARQEIDVVLARVDSSRREAERAAALQRVTLSHVQGELAGLVEAERARRAEAEARRVQAELAARQRRADEQREQAARKARDAAAKAATRDTARRIAPVVPPAVPPVGVRPGATATDQAGEPAGDAGAAPVTEGAAAAVAEARRQLGKPYSYGSPGPGSFDCSGLTSFAWRAGGRSLPHSSQAQMSTTIRVPIGDIDLGDLVFYGRPVHHVGIYAGAGQMVEASETGTPVRLASIYRDDLVGVGRVR